MGRSDEAGKTAASGEIDSSGTDREQTPKTVGKKRKQGEEGRSTRQQRGLDKMAGVMIHRIEHK